MSSWHESSARERGWVGPVALACSVPTLFFGGYFALDFLLRLFAGWIA